MATAEENRMRGRVLLTALAVAFSLTAWSSSFVVIREFGQQVGPLSLTFGRLGIGTIVLGVALLQRSFWVTPTPREWALLVVSGVGWYAGFSFLVNVAEHVVDAGTVALIVNLAPLLIVVFARVTLREPLPVWLCVGAVLAFIGTAIIAAGSSLVGGAALGIAAAGMAAVAYAAGLLTLKPVLVRIPALQASFLACLFGALAASPSALALLSDLRASGEFATVGVLYLGAVPTAAASFTWAYALKHARAGSVGVASYLIAPITVGMSWVALGELPTGSALQGGVLCLLGVAVANFGASIARPRPRQPGSRCAAVATAPPSRERSGLG